MIFGMPHMCCKITIQSVEFNGEDISRVDCMKYLGMKLDPYLTFKERVNYVKGHSWQDKAVGEGMLLHQMLYSLNVI